MSAPSGPPPPEPASGPVRNPTSPSSSPPQSTEPASGGRDISVGQILAGILLVLVLVFILENMDDVKIRFILGPKVEVPVFVALLIAAVVGALISTLMRLRRQRKRRKQA